MCSAGNGPLANPLEKLLSCGAWESGPEAWHHKNSKARTATTSARSTALAATSPCLSHATRSWSVRERFGLNLNLPLRCSMGISKPAMESQRRVQQAGVEAV